MSDTIPFDELCPVLAPHKSVHREPDPPLSPFSDHQGHVAIGKTHWNQAQRSLMGLLFRSKYYSRDAHYTKTWPAASNFPSFLLSPPPCWALKDTGSQVSRGEKLKHKSVLANLLYFLLPGAPCCKSFIYSTWIPLLLISLLKGKEIEQIKCHLKWWLTSSSEFTVLHSHFFWNLMIESWNY